MRQINAILAKHCIDMGASHWIASEVSGVALFQQGKQIERSSDLALRVALVAPLDIDDELPDRHKGSPAWQAIVGKVENAIPAQASAQDRQDRIFRLLRHPTQDAVEKDDIGVAVAGLCRNHLEACLRHGKIGEACGLDEIAGMRDMSSIEVATLESDVRIGRGEQRKAKSLAKTQLQHARRPQCAAWVTASDKRGKGQVTRGHLGIEVRSVADVSNIAVTQGHNTRAIRLKRSIIASTLLRL
nr:hypothetical protein [Labrys miyagiensis]